MKDDELKDYTSDRKTPDQSSCKKQKNEYDPSKDEAFKRNIEEAFLEEDNNYSSLELESQIPWISMEEEQKKKDQELNDEVNLDDISRHLVGQFDAEQAYEAKTSEKEIIEDIVSENHYRLPRALKVVGIISAVIALTGSFLLFTTPGRHALIHIAAQYAASRINYEEDMAQAMATENTPVVTLPEEIIPTDVGEEEKQEENVNLLLLGEEAIGSSTARGRTDLIMVATVDTEQGTLKLTSFMRDLYVKIPGYQENKLNVAYELGGISLLYETLKENFGLKMNGSLLVGFDDFEKIIDKLGGISVYLTKEEAAYLNETNYISKEENRNVKAGYCTLNGNQALGYCRIRYVGNADNETDDFGRTSRQRILLEAIFEKYKSLGYASMAKVMNDCLPYVTTDLSGDELSELLQKAYDAGIRKIETMRMPMDGMYEEGRVRNMEVLIPDMLKMNEALQSFLE